jgi:phosphoglycolate phosphatase
MCDSIHVTLQGCYLREIPFTPSKKVVIRGKKSFSVNRKLKMPPHTSLHPTVVFDLDGTLAETAPDIIGTLNVILTRDGFSPVPISAARDLVGTGARTLLKAGFAYHNQILDDVRCESLFHEFLSIYETRISQESYLFAGAKEALVRLKEAGHILAVCTNKGERQARLLLTDLGVADMFSAICGADTFEACKPNPLHLTRTIELAGGDPTYAIMVGDSPTDVNTARAANLPVIAVPFGYTPTPVHELNPDVVIEHFDEIDEAVRQITKEQFAEASAQISVK